jgi:UDP-2-acetamido-3-amino-2,3-dideoxy-glucuronate N-acetyltransferase
MKPQFLNQSEPIRLDKVDERLKLNCYFVHPNAICSSSSVGRGTRIWQFASVIRGTVLGEDCNVAHGACLDGPVFGDRCIISHNVAMGPGFRIDDDTFLGPGVVFCNDIWPTVAKEGWDLKAFQDGFVTIKVGKRCMIGTNATILPGVTIGDDAGVAAGAVCDKNVPDGYLFMRDGSLRRMPPPARRKRMKAAP